VIEGVETRGGPFTLGVQWHAECLTERHEHAALFAGLVDAAALHGRLSWQRAA
jgi:gamma-glutamyl-gamma-aminobutyrate hydrolase PuuD